MRLSLAIPVWFPWERMALTIILRVISLSQNLGAVLGVLLLSWTDVPIEIVEHSRDSPHLLILAGLASVSPHNRLH